MEKKLEDIAIDKSTEFERVAKEYERLWLLAKAQVAKGFNKENGFDEDSFLIGFVNGWQKCSGGLEGIDGFNYQDVVRDNDEHLSVPIPNNEILKILQMEDGDIVKITVEKI